MNAKLAGTMICFGLAVGLSGCRHKTPVVTLASRADAGGAGGYSGAGESADDRGSAAEAAAGARWRRMCTPKRQKKKPVPKPVPDAPVQVAA